MRFLIIYFSIYFIGVQHVFADTDITPISEREAINVSYPQPIRYINNLETHGPELSENLNNYMVRNCSHLDPSNPNIPKIVLEACHFPKIYKEWLGTLKKISTSSSVNTENGIDEVDDVNSSLYLKSGVWRVDYFLEPDEASGTDLILKSLLLQVALEKSMLTISKVTQKYWGRNAWGFVTIQLPATRAYLTQTGSFHGLLQFYDTINCSFRNKYCDTYKAAIARVITNIQKENKELIGVVLNDIDSLDSINSSTKIIRTKYIFKLIRTLEALRKTELKASELYEIIQSRSTNSHNLINEIKTQIINLSESSFDQFNTDLREFYLSIAQSADILKLRDIKSYLLVDIEWENGFSDKLVESEEYRTMKEQIKTELNYIKTTMKEILRNEAPL